MKLSTYAKDREITYRAAWERFRKGKIKGAYRDESGHVYVPHPNEVRLPVAAIYARVSSYPQKDDLDRQAERLVAYAVARGLSVGLVVKEVASGVNDQRPKLTKLLNDASWGTLVIEHKDRLSRVGFGWFETFLKLQGRRLDVANPAQDESSDLMTDFMSIVYSFAARMYGQRSARSRTKRTIAAFRAPS